MEITCVSNQSLLVGYLVILLLHVVILSGGAGARLWPVSNKSNPKAFIRINNGYSLLQNTFARCQVIDDIASITNISNSGFHLRIRAELDELSANPDYKDLNSIARNYILEPQTRDTAASFAIAALFISKKYGDGAKILYLPSDHTISNLDAFKLTVKEACLQAEMGKLTLIGVRPMTASTEYGYIFCSSNVDKNQHDKNQQNYRNITQTIQFTEKPSQKKAQEFLKSGDYLWNSGMLCVQAGRFLDEVAKCAPELYAGIHRCYVESDFLSKDTLSLNKSYFKDLPQGPNDRVILEKSQDLAVVHSNIEWQDVGTHHNFFAMTTQPDERGNMIEAEAELIDSTNCSIKSDKIVVAIGLEDILVIDTPDALLVAKNNVASQVKTIQKELSARVSKKQAQAKEQDESCKRPWGRFFNLEVSNGMKIKRLEVLPGASLSLQIHRHRTEHWIVVSGSAHVVNGEVEYVLQENESTIVPVGTKHRLSNLSTTELLVVIEIQLGSLLEESDIIRLEDKYGRQCALL